MLQSRTISGFSLFFFVVTEGFSMLVAGKVTLVYLAFDRKLSLAMVYLYCFVRAVSIIL